MRWLNDLSKSMDMSLSQLWEIVKYRKARHATRSCKELDMT